MKTSTDDFRARALTAGLKLTTMAEALGLSTGALSNKLAGRRSWTEDEVRTVRRLLAIYESTAASQTAKTQRVRKNRFKIPPVTRHRALFSPAVKRAFSFQPKMSIEEWEEKHFHLDGGEK